MSTDKLEFVVNDVFARIKTLEKLDTDVDLSKILDSTKANVSSWRSRDVIPFEKLINYSLKKQVDLEWLLTGKPGKKIINRFKVAPPSEPIKLKASDPHVNYGDYPEATGIEGFTAQSTDDTIEAVADRMTTARAMWEDAKVEADYIPPLEIEKALHIMLFRGDVSLEGLVYLLKIMKEVLK